MAESKIRFCQARPPEAKELTVPAPEMFVLHISHAFGKFPVELGADQVERLEGMKATWTDASSNPYDSLIRAIRRYGSINVWIERPASADEVREVLEAEAKSRAGETAA